VGRTLVEVIVIADAQTQIDGLDEELAGACSGDPGADHAMTSSPMSRLVARNCRRLLIGEIRPSRDRHAARDADIRDHSAPTTCYRSGSADPTQGDRRYEDALRRPAGLIARPSRSWRSHPRLSRAFTQRSQWLRRDLIGIGEIDRFERRLVEEWRFVFTT